MKEKECPVCKGSGYTDDGLDYCDFCNGYTHVMVKGVLGEESMTHDAVLGEGPTIDQCKKLICELYDSESDREYPAIIKKWIVRLST